MTEYVVLSTKAEKEFATRVMEYCKSNNLTPSSLIRALLEEEITAKKPITTIYMEINEKFLQIAKEVEYLRQSLGETSKDTAEALKLISEEFKSINGRLELITKCINDIYGKFDVTAEAIRKLSKLIELIEERKHGEGSLERASTNPN